MDINEENIMSGSSSENMDNEVSHESDAVIEKDTEIVPASEMEFDSYEDAKEFYNRHAMKKGFGTKIKSSWRNRKTNELNHALFTCSKEGFKKNVEGVCYRRPNIRVGCTAHMRIKLTSSKKWKVVSVDLGHNHPCSPSNSLRFRSHKRLDAGTKRRLEMNWRKDFKRKYVEKSTLIDIEANNPVQRYDVLYPYAIQVIEEGVISEAHYKFVLHGLKELKKNIQNIDVGSSGNDSTFEDTEMNKIPNTKVLDPLQVKRVGCPEQNTLQSSSETNTKSKKSQQSMDDFRHHKEFFRQSKLAESRSVGQNSAVDVELIGSGDGDSEERLSDISDSGLSMRTKTDGSISTLFPESPKPAASTEKLVESSEVPQTSQKHRRSAFARLPSSKNTSKGSIGLRKSTTGGSSSSKPLGGTSVKPPQAETIN